MVPEDGSSRSATAAHDETESAVLEMTSALPLNDRGILAVFSRRKRRGMKPLSRTHPRYYSGAGSSRTQVVGGASVTDIPADAIRLTGGRIATGVVRLGETVRRP